jgi:hypothetical protein
MSTRSAALSARLLGSHWLVLHVQYINRANAPRGQRFI